MNRVHYENAFRAWFHEVRMNAELRWRGRVHRGWDSLKRTMPK